jgi:DNA polymerase bacteriophage-type
MTEPKFLVVDYETRSRADLKASGSWEYSIAPSTSVLCVAWRYGTRSELPNVKTRTWSPAAPSPYGELVRALVSPDVTFVAHNALFEQVITRNVLSRIIHRPELKALPPERWICTATLAASLALPRNLEDACKALGLTAQKDMDGHKLMLRMSKPKKSGEWSQRREDLARLMQYCARDVDATTALFLACPPLSDDERRTWILDQKINLRGICVDRDLIGKALAMTEIEAARFDREIKALTGGAVETVGQRDAMLAWLKANDCFMSSLRADAVRDYLRDGLATGDARKVLELRQAGAKSSTKKFKAFEARSRSDGRVRDILLYQGAVPTGRFSGRGVQVQNLPKPSIRDTDLAAEVVKTGDLELVRAIYGNPLDTFASVLRSVIIPPAGHEFFCGDYAGIEARVLFWLADHARGLRMFREGEDLYRYMAADIYGVKVEDVTKAQRELGKRAILGASYGMGHVRFRETCRIQYGLEVSEDIAKRAVDTYRKVHWPVPRLWRLYEHAAIVAVERPIGTRVKTQKTVWYCEMAAGLKFLFCELPSGRRMAYPSPAVTYEPTSWGDKRPRLSYYGVNVKAKGDKWTKQYNWGGGLVENVCQAVARDLMVNAMHASEGAGYEIDITVHDELLTHRPAGKGSESEFEQVMAAPPAWASGLSVKVGTWTGRRYRK